MLGETSSPAEKQEATQPLEVGEVLHSDTVQQWILELRLLPSQPSVQELIDTWLASDPGAQKPEVYAAKFHNRLKVALEFVAICIEQVPEFAGNTNEAALAAKNWWQKASLSEVDVKLAPFKEQLYYLISLAIPSTSEQLLLQLEAQEAQAQAA